MTRLATPFARGTVAATAAALGLALLAATPASAAEVEGEEIFEYNGGGITVDAGPEYAGYDVFVQSQIPRTVEGYEGGGVWNIRKASLDAEGTARVVNFAGPTNLYFFSPSAVQPGLELPEPDATAAIYRGGEIEYDVDPEAGTAVVDGAVPTVVAPALADLQTYGTPLTLATVQPSSYTVDEAFDLTFSELYWAAPGDLDGQSTSTVVYSEPTTIGTSTIAGGSVTTTIGAEYTTDPHTVALLDGYGRVLSAATLDGGAAAPEAEPSATPTATATPVAVAPVSNSGSKPGAKPGAHLAETGVEAGSIALLASGLLAAGLGGLVLARRRRASA
ncbi:LPXTG cell wall anchor domain-containing protein [Rathayibacter festucae]|uniref:LPXTG cell wall anchor domain-containing protein n=1 Tax=Rathayibacter festucae TaxID=110937 RepID=UPI001FB2166D|nr:LPXTG cell wall anchor domain-containing protein [Rathayibacter festucae]MCJ1701540.1 LPXTG cell wall anchor domain-containing protein [Rathayibacter festucae]